MESSGPDGYLLSVHRESKADKSASEGARDLSQPLRIALAALGFVLAAWGGPLLLTRSPAEGRAGFLFALVVTLGGLAALGAAVAGPRTRLWPAALTLTAMAVVAVVLVVTWAIYVLLAHPDLGG
jgi:hypothetical protein